MNICFPMPILVILTLCCVNLFANPIKSHKSEETPSLFEVFTESSPCAQPEWKELLISLIQPDDASASTDAIRAELNKLFAGQKQQNKFLVACAMASDNTVNLVNFHASGIGYCSAVKDNVWCQLAALAI